MLKKLNKKLYYCSCDNFGDELNKYLFEKVFNIKFEYTTNIWRSDYTAIGSILGWSCAAYKNYRSIIGNVCKYLLYGLKISTLTVLGSGFQDWSFEPKIIFFRKMDFKIVRGKLTENYLRNNNLLKGKVILGDLGLLVSFIFKSKTKKYKLGIIPHFKDNDCPVFFDIRNKYEDSIIINVRSSVETVINQILECENIISSALHGLITADAFGIPNIWVENPSNKMDYFKYHDYYSIFGLENIKPLNIYDFMNNTLDIVSKNYKINFDTVKNKQIELYEFCKQYFGSL